MSDFVNKSWDATERVDVGSLHQTIERLTRERDEARGGTRPIDCRRCGRTVWLTRLTAGLAVVCHACVMSDMETEVERLTRERDGLRSQLGLAQEIAAEARAEVERLRVGLREMAQTRIDRTAPVLAGMARALLGDDDDQ